MNYYSSDNYSYEQSLDTKVSAVMKKVYVKMFVGLLLTALVAWVVAATATPGSGFLYYLATHSWLYWGLAILEIVLVIAISSGLRRMSSAMATGLFLLFSVVNGLTLSMIFVVYTTASIFKTFIITAGVFGAMSVYGYFTNRDLTKLGSFLYMALFGLIILLVVNIFWANSTLDWIISFLGVALFVGITAWDTQTIKQMAIADPSMANGRLATLGALNLYLDFINLFIYLLRFFGASRD